MKMTIKQGTFISYSFKIDSKLRWSAEFCCGLGIAISFLGKISGSEKSQKPFTPKFQEKSSCEEKTKKRVVENHN